MSSQTGPEEASTANDPQVKDSGYQPDRPSLKEYFQLLIAPFAATVLFTSGVYWIRTQSPTVIGPREQPTTVMVRLVPNRQVDSSPAPAPVAVNGIAALAAISPDQSNQAAPATPPPATAVTPEKALASMMASREAAPAARSESAMKYQQAVLRHIGRYQRYPIAARKNHLQGTVQASVSMRRDGSLLDVWVEKSSGVIILDNEAIETIRRAQPLPPIPSELPDAINIHVSLAFDLSE
jgi:protein TonB